MFYFGERVSPAQRRYQQSAIGIVLAYFGLFFGSMMSVHRWHPHGWHLWLAALLPSLPMVGIFVITARYLREERDEFQRDLVVRCLLWGIGAVMTVELFAGFLRIFGWEGSLPPFTSWFVLCGSVMVAKFTYKLSNRVPAGA